MAKKTRFAHVLEYLEGKNISQSQVAKTLDDNLNIAIDSAKISHYKSGKQNPTNEVIEAMHEHFGINPDYLNETSDVLLDKAGLLLEKFNSIFKNWSTTEKIYTNDKGEQVLDTYLHLTMNEAEYNFLKTVDHAKFLKDQGMKSFDEELEQCKKECHNASSNLQEYVLIPRDCFVEIITAEIRNRKLFDELINLENHFHYCDEE